ncbi:hypothetical protein [Streptomyces sp. NPDC001221]
MHTLTELLVDLTRFIDSTIDEDGEPRAAVKQLDFVAAPSTSWPPINDTRSPKLSTG